MLIHTKQATGLWQQATGRKRAGDIIYVFLTLKYLNNEN